MQASASPQPLAPICRHGPATAAGQALRAPHASLLKRASQRDPLPSPSRMCRLAALTSLWLTAPGLVKFMMPVRPRLACVVDEARRGVPGNVLSLSAHQ